jgi:predicted secreted hydrolase
MSNIKKTHRKYKKHRIPKRYFIIAGLLIMTCGLGAWFFYEVSYSKPAEIWFETKAAEGSLISLPKDDAPHQAKIEWWYYNGHLSSESGKQFSFHYTIFLVTGLMSHTVAHVSFNDYQTGQHYTEERRVGGNPSIGIANRFDFALGDWIMKGQNGADRIKVVGNDFDFDLNLTSTLPPVFHGKNGIIPMDIGGSSYYYSRTRMAISGSVKIGKKAETVKGIAWFDHQWGDFSTSQLSWDWFSLQLDDGADIMIYNLRDKASKTLVYTGSITKNGVTEILSNTDFTLTPGAKWISNKSGIAYPIEWNINIPNKNIAITTRSIIDNSEFDAKLTTYNIYWEGAVKVKGSHTGQGFMELSGYRAKH